MANDSNFDRNRVRGCNTFLCCSPITIQGQSVLFFVGAVVDCTDVLRQLIGNHGGEFFLISVPDCLFIVPAFEFQHIQSAVHPCDLLFHVGFPFLKHGLALGIGGWAFSTPIHELPDVIDLHAGLFQTFNDPECFNLRVTEFADAGHPFHVREKPLLVIIAQRGDRQAEHLCHLSN